MVLLEKNENEKIKANTKFIFIVDSCNNLLEFFWSERSACASGSNLGSHYFGPSEVHATSGANLGRPLFLVIGLREVRATSRAKFK